jgi:hypothetical protein
MVIGFHRLRHELSRFSPYTAPFRTFGMIDLGWLFLFHIYKSYMKRQTNKALTREKRSPYHPDKKLNRRMRRNFVLNYYIFLKLKNIKKNFIYCYVLIRYSKRNSYSIAKTIHWILMKFSTWWRFIQSNRILVKDKLSIWVKR